MPLATRPSKPAEAVVTTVGIPPGAGAGSICDMFAASARRFGDRTAVVCADRRITYRELDSAATGIARRLRHAGLRRGQIVALVAQRSVEAIAAILGILKAGGAYLPLDISYPAELLRAIHQDSGSRLTVVQRALSRDADIPRFQDSEALYIEADLTLTGGDATPTGIALAEPPVGAEDLAYVMYTSGSTGRPKGVLIPHRGVVRLVVGCDFAALGPDEVILHLAPLSFDASTFEIWGALLNGGSLAVIPAPHPSLDDIAAAVRSNGVTTMWLTAGLFHLMVERRLSGLTSLRQLLAGGDVLSPPHVVKALEALPGCRIVNGYGPTENTTFTCCYAIPRDHSAQEPVPIGTAIGGTTVHILDEAMQPVPDGEDGELYTGGAGVALGYLNRPEMTAERFVADPLQPAFRLYRTGDRVRRRPDGNIEFLGRVDRQVKIAGKRVELDEVEAALRRIEAIRDAAAISRVDDTGHRSIAAFVTPREGHNVSAAQLRARLRAVVPAYMIPAEITVLDSLPLSPVGKVDRTRLAALASPAPAPRPAAAANRTQDILLGVWRRILGADAVGLDDNFFDIGGTSLQLIAAHAEIAEAFPIRLAPVDLFEHPTIRTLAARIDGADASRHALFAADERARRRGASLARARSALNRALGA